MRTKKPKIVIVLVLVYRYLSVLSQYSIWLYSDNSVIQSNNSIQNDNIQSESSMLILAKDWQTWNEQPFLTVVLLYI